MAKAKTHAAKSKRRRKPIQKQRRARSAVQDEVNILKSAAVQFISAVLMEMNEPESYSAVFQRLQENKRPLVRVSQAVVKIFSFLQQLQNRIVEMENENDEEPRACRRLERIAEIERCRVALELAKLMLRVQVSAEIGTFDLPRLNLRAVKCHCDRGRHVGR